MPLASRGRRIKPLFLEASFIGGLGELVQLVPPIMGRSASFRLRFRFVLVVRAVRLGEAKLRGRMTIIVLIAGPPGSESPGVCARPFGCVRLGWAGLG